MLFNEIIFLFILCVFTLYAFKLITIANSIEPLHLELTIPYNQSK